jgi:uncharacterized membrane protein
MQITAAGSSAAGAVPLSLSLLLPLLSSRQRCQLCFCQLHQHSGSKNSCNGTQWGHPLLMMIMVVVVLLLLLLF